MVISWYGEGCFKIQTGSTIIITDPFENTVGLAPPRNKSDITIKTATDLPISFDLAETQRVIYGPGEYEINGAGITGWAIESRTDTVRSVFIVSAEGIRLGLLGYLSGPPPAAIIEKFEAVDILFVPAGGKPFIEQTAAAKLVKQINPKIVVPALFKIPGLLRKSDDTTIFLHEFGNGIVEPKNKLTIRKKGLPPTMRLFTLTP